MMVKTLVIVGLSLAAPLANAAECKNENAAYLLAGRMLERHTLVSDLGPEIDYEFSKYHISCTEAGGTLTVEYADTDGICSDVVMKRNRATGSLQYVSSKQEDCRAEGS